MRSRNRQENHEAMMVAKKTQEVIERISSSLLKYSATASHPSRPTDELINSGDTQERLGLKRRRDRRMSKKRYKSKAAKAAGLKALKARKAELRRDPGYRAQEARKQRKRMAALRRDAEFGRMARTAFRMIFRIKEELEKEVTR